MTRTKAQLAYKEHVMSHRDETHSHPYNANGDVFGVNPKGYFAGKRNNGFYVSPEKRIIYVWDEDTEDGSYWKQHCGNVTPEMLMEWANVLLMAAEHMIEVADEQS